MNRNNAENPVSCKCGKCHLSDIKSILAGKKVIQKLPDELKN